MNWFWRLFSRKRMDIELDKELRFHVESQVADKIRSGIPENEARRLARLEFGGIDQIKEGCRQSRGTVWLESLLQDVGYGLRQLRKSPGFTLTAVLTLALGIGANAAIFTLVNAVLLRDLPVVDPKSLVRLGNWADCCQNSGPKQDGNYSMFSTETYEQLKKNTPEFEELAAMQAGFENRPVVVRREAGQEAAMPRMGEFVSGNYFGMFGLQPAKGRLISASDDVAGAPLVAVMSYSIWKNVYSGDDSVVGSTFWMNTKPVTVIGVAPEGFYGDRMSSTPPDFYLPIATVPNEMGGKGFREIGIRMALGANRNYVVAMILRTAILQTLFGLAIGIPVAFYGATLVRSQLYGLTTVSGSALWVALCMLLAAACVAGAIPALRAASVDPVRALRAE